MPILALQPNPMFVRLIGYRTRWQDRARPEVAAAVSGGRHDSMSATRVRHSASGRGVRVAGEDLQTNKVGVRRPVLLDPAPGPEVAPHDKGIDESLAALIGEVRVGEAEAP